MNNNYHIGIFDITKNFEISISNQVLFHLYDYDMALDIFIPLILIIVFLSISLNSRMGKRK